MTHADHSPPIDALAADAFADFVELTRYRAAHQPDLRVYSFITGGDRAEQHLTCADLDRRAGAVAAALAQVARPGDRVLLLFPPGIDYIAALFGCMYAGVVAVPAYPVEPAQAERTLRRLIGIVENCTPAAILSTTIVRDDAHRIEAGSPALGGLRWITVDTLGDSAGRYVPPPVNHRSPVYLQYTSGSTGAPKGVMISHRNLLHNSALIASRFEHDTDSRGVIWLPPYHDMGLIGGILQPLYVGFPVTLMSHVDFLKHPLRWLRTIGERRATTSGGPNFAYQMLATMRIADADFDKLDLSSWDLAFVGAEPIRHGTLHAFSQRFARCGFDARAFYPCYGLAEHTLFMTGGLKSQPPVVVAPRDAEPVRAESETQRASTAIGCGDAAGDSLVRIVDPDTRIPCDDGRVGEIWAQGPSVALGYWNNRALSEQIFEAELPGYDGRFLRTGDYGYRSGPEVFVTGRLKDMMLIRGANHYPHDVEETIEALDAELFRPGGCAVFALEADAAPQVIVVRELRARYLKAFGDGDRESGHTPDALFGKLRQAINLHHGIAVHNIVFTSPSAIPKTTSGKVQRHACRELFLNDTLPVITQWRAQLDAPNETRNN
ncbi:fatty acyl-AMP ligase [Burkholderia oklahomensis]|uniref:fatty acyl-AMP ligase n=1 Tax=Burkholderia oklahomensis TaxID=342113 RepID=UPI00016A8368|nr:fatty acyl-AMP ligase [Burkholderia oklahomensis]AJX34601.1 AMP-binding enzyme family protein [Burkholderia oklahomensis C6786]AOI48092.1 fatty acyl-AMP ligase [Burkholderia oklahomensis C6786]KUY50039.1 fatty acyl-AMP ligase [Burkholderia oklahomensis C6786]MBI0363784.1 fatty acyl-AMP ligase [Burkholderia oklahomensis]SUY27910.1 Long-chain-fatty-acid--AMP ligase FadD28 [Burkholderia oklahomensis]